MATKTSSKKRAVPRAGRSGDDGARVWAEVSVTVNLGEYESAKVSLGQSVSTEVQGPRRKAMRRALLDECEQEVARRARKVKRIWKAS